MKTMITGMAAALLSVPVCIKSGSEEKNRKNVYTGMSGYIMFFVFLICDFMIINRMKSSGYSIYTVVSSVLLTNVMFVLARTDIRKRIIPNRYLAGLLILRSVILFFSLVSPETALYSAADSAAGLTAGFVITLIMYILSKNGLGAGDVKMFAVIGYFAGLTGILDILLYTCIFCFLFSALFLLLKKCSLKSSIPMAPFAFAGTVFYFAFMV